MFWCGGGAALVLFVIAPGWSMRSVATVWESPMYFFWQLMGGIQDLFRYDSLGRFLAVGAIGLCACVVVYIAVSRRTDVAERRYWRQKWADEISRSPETLLRASQAGEEPAAALLRAATGNIAQDNRHLLHTPGDPAVSNDTETAIPRANTAETEVPLQLRRNL